MIFTTPVRRWLLIVCLSACPELVHGKESIEELEIKTEPKDAKAAANDSKFPLKDVKPLVEEILSGKNTDQSELAYVAARGGALLLAISKILHENPHKDRSWSEKMAQSYMEDSHRFLKVAQVIGAITGKSDENIHAQFRTLMEVYLQEMARSKQLNNEYMSTLIVRELNAIISMAPLVNELDKTFEASSKILTKEKQPER